jgi:S1-C subfamily serine protease
MLDVSPGGTLMKKTLLLCLLSALFGGILAVWLSDPPGMARHTAAQEPAAPPPGLQPVLPLQPLQAGAPGGAALLPDDFTPEERVNIAVYEHVNRSVVNITTRSVRNEGFFFGDVASEGEGSGVVIDHQGRILTNFHVVDEAREVQVTLFNSKTYDAKTVGQDPASDVAVVQIEAPPGDLYPVTFGDSTRLRVGQKVFAIGNPFGLERTLTTGIISSLNRSLPSRSQNRTIKQIIQIDAAINPGNSGGPLLDTHGRMIGINTAIASRTGESAGVGFAIPVNTVGRVLPQIIQRGHVVRPDVGITRVYQTDHGLLLATLTKGGAAERAGLRGPKIVRRTKRQGPFVYDYQTVDRSAADLIVAVDGNKILTADDFLTAIESKQPGEVAMITVIRDGRQANVPVKLDAGE